MDSIEASGKSVDDAILQALSRLGKRRDEVDVTVLQEPQRATRGVGARDARVRVRVLPTHQSSPHQGTAPSPEHTSQWPADLDESEIEPAPPPVQSGPSARPFRQPRQRSVARPAPTVRQDSLPRERPATPQPQRVPSIFRQSTPAYQAPNDNDEPEFDESSFDEELTAHTGPVATQGAAPEQTTRKAIEVLRSLLQHMGISATIEITSRDPLMLNVRVNNNAQAQSMLIGRRGETLASLQLIVNLMVNQRDRDHYRVMVDVENYRRRRDDNLRSLAMRIASQVQQSRRPMMLEPMTPYERRIVHLTLQDSPIVQTQSTGEGDQRRVVVSLRQGSMR